MGRGGDAVTVVCPIVACVSQEAVLDGVSSWRHVAAAVTVTTVNAMSLAVGGATKANQHILEAMTKRPFKGQVAGAQAALRELVVPSKKRQQRRMLYVLATPSAWLTTVTWRVAFLAAH